MKFMIQTDPVVYTKWQAIISSCSKLYFLGGGTKFMLSLTFLQIQFWPIDIFNQENQKGRYKDLFPYIFP